MTSETFNEVREAAEGATPGPWIYHRETGPYSYRDEVWPDSPCKDEPEWLDPIVNDIYTKEDAKFIATANPQKVLEILDALRAAERERDDLRYFRDQIMRQAKSEALRGSMLVQSTKNNTDTES
jgi:hypothetical protein